MSRRYNGEVVVYDRERRTGEVHLTEPSVTVAFHSTSFYAGLVRRAPRQGDSVSVALSGDPSTATVRDVQGVWVR